nr:hypothetical protein [Tanacetum cinerariifolium]
MYLKPIFLMLNCEKLRYHCLANDAVIYLLDEPTKHLNSEERAFVSQVIKTTARYLTDKGLGIVGSWVVQLIHEGRPKVVFRNRIRIPPVEPDPIQGLCVYFCARYLRGEHRSKIGPDRPIPDRTELVQNSGPKWYGPVRVGLGRSSVWSGPTRHNLQVFGKIGPDRRPNWYKTSDRGPDRNTFGATASVNITARITMKIFGSSLRYWILEYSKGQPKQRKNILRFLNSSKIRMYRKLVRFKGLHGVTTAQFHSYQDAKLIMKAIEKRYEGNKESKKVRRTLLKQQYKNFAASSSKTLDQTFDRLQKLISQLEIQDEVIEQEDINLKLLRSLPSEWKTRALIWRNKAKIETISLDDLYNNFKIYEPELTGSSSTSQNPQYVAFISFNSTNNTNEADNTAYGVSTAHTQDGIRGYDWSYQAEEEYPINYALMALTSLESSSSLESKVDSCSKTCLKAYATIKEQYYRLSSDYKKSQFNLVSYKAGLQSVEERLVHYKKNEAVFEEKINILNLKVRLRKNALVEYTKKLEKAEKERDDLKLTLEKYHNSSKSLNTLLESQVSDKVKTRLGYKAASSAVENFVNSSKMIENQENVKSRSDKGYHTGVYNTVETKHVKNNNFSPPIIEEWISDDESEVEFEPKVKDKTVRPSIEKIKFVKPASEKVKKLGSPKKPNSLIICARQPTSEGVQGKKSYDTGFSRHMTGNKCYLIDYEDYDGGFVSFGDGKGRIFGKDKIKTGTLDSDDV